MDARTMSVCLLVAGACLGQVGFPLRAAAQAPAPQIEELWLVDAATDTRLVRIDDYQNLDLAFLPEQLSVEAVASVGTGSVRFAVDDVPGALENLEPYALGGDSLGDFVPVPALRQPGWIRISATPYGAENGTGPVGQTFTRRFYRLKTDYVVDSVADLSDAQPGDGVCRTVELRRAQVAMKAIVAPGPGPSPERPKPNPGVDLPIGIRNVCTLRAAIEEANATPGRQTISLDGRNGRTYELTLGELKVTDGLAIYGHQQPTVDAGKRSRVMSISGPVGEDRLVDLIDLDLANGDATALEPGARGGVISVEQAMRSMNRPVRQLRGQIGDATKRDENLRMINEMQRGCVAAKGLPAPEGVLANVADDAAKAEKNEHYRRDLIKALRILVDMEVAVMDGKGDEASKKLDELIAARDKAHEEMGIKDDE